MEPKTKKRIVSKGEYGFIIFRKTLLGVGSFGLVFVTTICCFASLGLFIVGCLYGNIIRDWGAALLVGILGYVGMRLAERGMDKAFQKEMIPLTRANTADIPAPDSLVRASEEPRQAQEAVLLRAAAEGQQTPSEQLVRAAGGTEA